MSAEATDGELLAKIRIRADERPLQYIGCLLAAGLAVLPALEVTSRVGAAGLLNVVVFSIALLCSFPLLGLLLSPLIAKRQLRAHKAIDTLRKRWGQASIDSYEDDTRALLDAFDDDDDEDPGPPDFAFVLRGHELPAGRIRWVRVLLWNHEPPAATADLRIAPPVLEAADADPQGRMERGDAVLPDELAAALLDEVAGIGGDLARPTANMKDGFPCEALILRRTPAKTYRAAGNLADSSKASHPTIRMLRLLADAAQAVIDAEA